VNTKNYGGKKLTKSATIQTNDKENPKLRVTISGQVRKFVTIKPKTAKLSGSLGNPIETKLTIIPEKSYPFKLIGSEAKKGENIEFDVKEVKKEDQSEYLLTVRNLRKEKGRYTDTISLKTDSDIQSEIEIRVYGNISEVKKVSKEEKTAEKKVRE